VTKRKIGFWRWLLQNAKKAPRAFLTLLGIMSYPALETVYGFIMTFPFIALGLEHWQGFLFVPVTILVMLHGIYRLEMIEETTKE